MLTEIELCRKREKRLAARLAKRKILERHPNNRYANPKLESQSIIRAIPTELPPSPSPVVQAMTARSGWLDKAKHVVRKVFQRRMP